MASTSANQEQQHPQARGDREIVNSLLVGEQTDYNFAELARLLIRYRGFPGAKDIQADLEKVLQKWQLTEAQLYEKTRQIHDAGEVYRGKGKKGDQDDWS